MAIILIGVARSIAADPRPAPTRPQSALVRLAAERFPGLTRCERAMLEYADVKLHADFPACGPSPLSDDPSNDPIHADKWDHQREVRADIIRWLLVDPDATRQLDPHRIELLGARVVGSLDLDNVRAPVGIFLFRSAIPDPMSMVAADLGIVALTGSHTGAIEAAGIHVRGGVFLRDGFEASARVFFGDSRIDGDFDCAGGSFKHSPRADNDQWGPLKPALFLGASRINGPVWLTGGFKADGEVSLTEATFLSLFCWGGPLHQPRPHGNRCLWIERYGPRASRQSG